MFKEYTESYLFDKVKSVKSKLRKGEINKYDIMFQILKIKKKKNYQNVIMYFAPHFFL